jgi:hypothetical protein
LSTWATSSVPASNSASMSVHWGRRGQQVDEHML